jgi:hypothetical protein
MRKILLLGLLGVLGVACDPPSDATVEQKFEKIVRDRASIEFECGFEHIAVASIEGWAYRAEGCGKVQVYECGFDSANLNGSDNDKVLYVCHAESSAPMVVTKPATPTCNAPDGG